MKRRMNHIAIELLTALGCVAAASTALSQTAQVPSMRLPCDLSQSWAAAAAPNSLYAMIGGAMDSEPMFLAAKSQGYLGVGLRDVTEEQVSVLRLQEARGAEIVTVDHDGPAGKVGLREHDVVLQMNGQQIEGEEQLRRMLRDTPAGRTVVFIISREGQQQSISVQLANRADVERQAWEQHFSVPDPQNSPAPRGDSETVITPNPGFVSNGSGTGTAPSPHSSGFLPMFTFHSAYTGAMLDSLSTQLATYFGAKPGTGLLVRSVEANSPASRAGLKAGDVVVKVNSAEVSQPNDWLRSMRENKGKSVQVTVLRNKQEQNLSLTPGTPKKK